MKPMMESIIAVTTMRARSWKRSDRYMKKKRPTAPLIVVSMIKEEVGRGLTPQTE